MRQPSEKEILKHASEIAEQGYSIMEGVIDKKFRIQLLDELERLESVRPGGDIPPGPFTGFVTRRWFALLNDGDVWQQVALHSDVLAVLHPVVGENFLLSTLGSAEIGPGEA